LRSFVVLLGLGLALGSHGQSFPLAAGSLTHDSTLAVDEAVPSWERTPESSDSSSPSDLVDAPEPASPSSASADASDPALPSSAGTEPDQSNARLQQDPDLPVDADGKPIPLERLQPKRILGFMPNFRSVSEGEKPHPPGWKYNFKIATRQATDYSSFIFLGVTSLSAIGIDEHPVLGKGIPGFWAYTWRGFLDKTDGTYISAWFLPSLIHEDTRFYAMGTGHSIPIRALYVMSRQVVTKTYGGRNTPNIAGLGGKVLTQIVSRTYYPPGATSFSVLATKFAYASMRDIAITSIREFYPDAAAHFVRKHREKVARMAAKDAQSAENAVH
jgi:hypothetical protein